MPLPLKLFTAMFLATISVVGCLGFIIQWSFDQGFLEYVNLEEQKEINRLTHQLELYYGQHQSWEELRRNPLVVLMLHAQTEPDPKIRKRILAIIEHGNMPDWMADKNTKKERRHPLERIILLDQNSEIIFGSQLDQKLPHMIALMDGERRVGSLGLYPPKKISETNQLLFMERQKEIMLIASLAAILITAGVSMLLAYHLTRPIQKLSTAANNLAKGDYTTRVRAENRGAVGKLLQDFNTLATTLEENESQRKRWLSDIAHELRTPLTSLMGEVEALQDGIRKPDERTLGNLHQGITRLKRLVEDLYDLTRSEIGMLSLITDELDLSDLVAGEVESYTQEAANAGLSLTMEPPATPAPIWGDRQRLQQLLGNLLTNSIRYTDGGGKINVSVSRQGSSVVLDIHDTAPGVDDENRPHLFDRLYRVEQSRNRALGGAGLGLAICEQIVLAHHGTISATNSPLGGLHLQVVLPGVDMESI